MAQFISMSRRKIDEFGKEAFTPELVEAEANRVRELYVAGSIRQIWRRGDAAGAVLIWEATSEQEVRDGVNSLPLAQRGMLHVDAVFELHPYPGMGPR